MTFLEAAKVYIREHGSQNQIERFEAGMMPDRELKALVAHHLWEPFYQQFHVRRRVEPEVVEHLAVRRKQAEVGAEVVFEMVEPADEITEEEWEVLNAIKRVAEPVGGKVSPICLYGVCGTARIRYPYVKVEVTVGDRPLKLELSLK